MSENDYGYILNPKTGKLVKTCGSVGTKLIKNYEHDEIYNPKTKRNVQFTKTTGQKVYKKYKELLHHHSKKGGNPTVTTPTTRCVQSCGIGSKTSSSCRTTYLHSDSKVPKGKEIAKQQHCKIVKILKQPIQPKLDMSSKITIPIQQPNGPFSTALVSTAPLTVSPPPPPPTITNSYILDFECEPKCDENLKTILQQLLELLITFIDTLVSLLQPTIPNLSMIKTFIFDFLLTEAFTLLIKDSLKDNKLVNIAIKSIVFNALGNNIPTIAAKLLISNTELSGYTQNLPQIIVKKNVIELLKNPQGLYNKYNNDSNKKYMMTIFDDNMESLKKVSTELSNLLNDDNLLNAFNITKEIRNSNQNIT